MPLKNLAWSAGMGMAIASFTSAQDGPVPAGERRRCDTLFTARSVGDVTLAENWSDGLPREGCDNASIRARSKGEALSIRTRASCSASHEAALRFSFIFELD